MEYENGKPKYIIELEKHMIQRISEVICVRCYKRWICVRPEGTYLKHLECPVCGPDSGAVIETGEQMR